MQMSGPVPSIIPFHLFSLTYPAETDIGRTSAVPCSRA
jgi:hypothetical protein